MTRTISAEQGLGEAAQLLASGGLVAFPTETVYGLGANAFDAKAVARIFEAKKRPFFDPLIVHISDLADLDRVTAHVPEVAQKLIDRFWPGPTTLVLPRSSVLPGIVTSGLDTVAVRMPAHPIARKLIELAGVPVAAPSANSFGQLSPTRAEHVVDDLGDAVDLVLDGGSTMHGIESTIIDVSIHVPSVLRFGAVAIEEIEEVIGSLNVQTNNALTPKSPGQLDSHYSPRTPLVVVTLETVIDPEAVYLAFSQKPVGRWRHVEVLAPDGDLRKAAARLFEVLHQLDDLGATAIYAENVPDEGIGRAINDRLRRASS